MLQIVALREAVIMFRDSIMPAIERVIADNQHIIIDMNAEQQLYEQGINIHDVSIDAYEPYSPATIEIKMQKGQPTDRVTLRDEGDFEGSIYLRIGSDEFEIDATDWKTGNIVHKYGDILGLTDSNINELITSYIIPSLVKLRLQYFNIKS